MKGKQDSIQEDRGNKTGQWKIGEIISWYEQSLVLLCLAIRRNPDYASMSFEICVEKILMNVLPWIWKEFGFLSTPFSHLKLF